MRRCKACGTNLDHRPRAEYCDGKCRVNFSRGHRPATVVSFPSQVEPVEAGADELMSVEDVARELQSALRALGTPPTAKSALAREYLATLQLIAASRPVPKDEVDELLERRIHRAGA